MKTTPATTRLACAELDESDVLASLRGLFDLDALDERGAIYLDGNSLGALPRSVPERLERAVREDWGRGLIGSWVGAGWLELPRRLGDAIGGLIGARPGETVVADSTSANLYKALHVAVSTARARDPRREVILIPNGEFPTDRYVADAIARDHGLRVETQAPLDERVAVCLQSLVDYRTGALHDLARVTEAQRDAGAVSVWDLSHATGVVPVDLHAAGAELAVGCGYKYLNGGPGAPSFVWCHPELAAVARQPLAGWMGHRDPFAMAGAYEPAAGSGRFLCGTPPVLSMIALGCGLETVLAAEPLGGVAALRAKSVALTELFRERVESALASPPLAGRARVITPRRPEERGSQVSVAVEAQVAGGRGARGLTADLEARGVVADFRTPDVVRFGFAPLYTRFVDVWDAAERLAEALGAE